MAEAKKAQKKTTKKPGTKAVEEAKAKAPKAVEQTETIVETDVSAAAIEEAKQEATVVAEKRSTKPIAKAGRRSAKAIKESEEKQAKEERKAEVKEDQAEAKPKQQKPARSKLERRSKGFRESAKLIEKDKAYSIADAMDLAAKTSHVKFDATVELHVNLGVDPRQADQNVRDTVVLPAGTGKTVRVAVFGDVDSAAAAKKAGADIAAADEFLQLLDKEQLDFDVLIATPAVMPKLGKYARLLGPKGLMPNPKSGTVTTDVAKAVTEARAGRVEYRVDSTGIIHVGVGKVSFGKEKLTDNAKAVLSSIKGNKPASIKSAYIKSIHAATTMGPSIPIDISDV